MGTDTTIKNSSLKVKGKGQKITPVYKRPISNKNSTTLESLVQHAGEIKRSECICIMANLPFNIKMTLSYLKDKNPNLGTASKVAYFLYQIGFPDFEKILDLQASQKKEESDFQFSRELGIKYRYNFGVPVDREMATRISDIAVNTGLPQSTCVILCLLLGMMKSHEWIPERYREMAEREIGRFQTWMQGR